MAIGERALLLPASRGHRLTDWDLRESIRHLGLLQPLFFYRGELADGSRRRYLCKVLRLPVRRVDCEDRIEAARFMWQHHPQRAWKMFAQEGDRPVNLAHLFGCSLADIPRAEQLRDFKHKGRSSKTAGTERQALPNIVVPRDQLAAAKQLCKERGTTLSACVRRLIAALSEGGPDAEVANQVVSQLFSE